MRYVLAAALMCVPTLLWQNELSNFHVFNNRYWFYFHKTFCSYIICYLLLKCLTVRWFCGLYIHIKFHWPKLHVVEGTLYCIVFPRSCSYAA